MKRISALIFLILFSSTSFAEEINIFEESSRIKKNYYSPVFQLNANTARAWMLLTSSYCWSPMPTGGCRADDMIVTKKHELIIPGLIFDKDTEEIVMAADGNHIVCATTYLKRSAFGRLKRIINPTGACRTEGHFNNSDIYSYTVNFIY